MGGFEHVARATGVCAVAIFVIAAMMFCIGAQLIALELAKSADEAVSEIAKQGVVRIEHNIKLDWFFIAAYTLMFLGFAALRSSTATAVVAVLTAVCDVAENLGVLKALRGMYTPLMPWASSLKWLCFFLLLLLSAPLFFHGARWLRWIGWALRAIGAVGVALSLSLAFTNAGGPAIGLALIASFLPLLPATAVLLFRPRLLKAA